MDGAAVRDQSGELMPHARNGQHIDQATKAAYTHNPPWPGIFDGHDAFCKCTWAPKNGVYQVKQRDLSCPNEGHGRTAATAADRG